MRSNYSCIYSLNSLSKNRQFSLPSILQNNRIVLQRSTSIQKQQMRQMKSLKLKKWKKTKKQQKNSQIKKKHDEIIFDLIGDVIRIENNMLLYTLQIDGLKPPIKDGSSILSYRDCIYLYGGIGSMYDRSWWQLDFNKKKWHHFFIGLDKLQTPHSGHRINAYNDTICISGGMISFTEHSKQRQLSPCYQVYKIISQQKAPQFEFSINMLKPRFGHSSSIINNNLVLIGGIGLLRNFIKQVQVLNLISHSRFYIYLENQLQIVFHQACTIKKNKTFDNNIIIFGGITPKQECINQIYCLTITGTNLKCNKISTIGKPPQPRYMHSMISISKNLIIAGGRNICREIFNNVFNFNLESFTWIQINIKGMKFQPRFGHSAVVISQKMIIFGGIGYRLYIDPTTYVFELQTVE